MSSRELPGNNGASQIALASRVYERSHAGWAVASVLLAITVPIVVLAPAAGLLLDRLRPKPVLIASSIVASGVMLGLTQVTGVAGTLALAVGQAAHDAGEPLITQLRAGLGYLRGDRTARLLFAVVGVMLSARTRRSGGP